MRARRSHMRQQREEGPLTIAKRRWGTQAARGTFTRGLALLLAALGVLALTATFREPPGWPAMLLMPKKVSGPWLGNWTFPKTNMTR